MWVQAKELLDKLNSFLQNIQDEGAQRDLVIELKNHAQRLYNPFVNQTKSSTSASLINQSRVGQTIDLGGQKIVLTSHIVQDSESLSDMLNLDLLVALDLILCDISRGLCAVLCYYDAHRTYLLIIKALLDLRADGFYPDFVNSELEKFVEGFFQDAGFFEKCLKVYETLDKRTDYEKLYQYQYLSTLFDIELTVYEIICTLVANCPVSQQKNQLESLFTEARKMELDSQRRDSVQPVVRKLFRLPQLAIWTGINIFIGPQRLRMIGPSCEEIFESFENNLKLRWSNLQLKASVMFCYALAVKSSVGTFARRDRLDVPDPVEFSLNHRALQFLAHRVLKMPNIHNFSNAVEVVDNQVKTFLSFFPEKVQELYNVCDEELFELSSGEQTSLLKDYLLNFKTLLEAITGIYQADNEKTREWSEAWFDQNGDLINCINRFNGINNPTLYVGYLEMLTALCQAPDSALFLFRTFSNNPDPLYDWASMFSMLRMYVAKFRQHVATPFQNMHTTHPSYLNPKPGQMSAEDLHAIVSWLRLCSKVAKQCAEARRFFANDNHFNAIGTLIDSVTTRFPTVMKRELYKLLAVLAEDETNTVQLWTTLRNSSICSHTDQANKLSGIAAELEEVECKENSYDSTEGFLHLVKALFSRRNFNVADVHVTSPYVTFTIKSAICPFDQRGYKDPLQKWRLVSLGCDALFELLRRFHISSVSVARRGPQVFVLSQLLNDSDLCRAIIRVMADCAQCLEETIAALSLKDGSRNYQMAKAKNEAALSALRLLSHACVVNETVRAAFRSAPDNTPVFLAPLDSLLLSPLPNGQNTNYVQLLNTFVDEQEVLLKHTYYVVRILSELADSASPDTQRAILETFMTNTNPNRCIYSRLISINAAPLIVDDQDLVKFDLKDVTEQRLRGEIARDLLTMFTKVLTRLPSQLNMVHLLFGYSFKNAHSAHLTMSSDSSDFLNCTQSVILILETLAETTSPEDVPFAMLFEPALRVMLKLVSVKSISSDSMLTLLRNNHDDLIYRLAKSDIFTTSCRNDVTKRMDSAWTFRDQSTTLNFADSLTDLTSGKHNNETSSEAFRRLCRGLILEVIAVDFSVAMYQGHTDTGRKYLEVLLTTDHNSAEEWGLVWSLIQNTIGASLEIQTPSYYKFDKRKVQDVLDLCLRRSAVAVDQYDVEYLHFLLAQEIAAITNEDLSDFQDDANKIMYYCCRYNAQRRLEGSCVQLLSGWIALVNAIVFFSPLPFIPIETQQTFCTDALALLKEYVQKVAMNEEVLGAVSNCCFGLVRQLVKFASVQYQTDAERKLVLGDILNLLVSCCVMSSYNRHSLFKMNIYASILCVIQACTEESHRKDSESIAQWNAAGPDNRDRVLQEADQNADDQKNQTLLSLIQERSAVHHVWSQVLKENANELVEACASDIEFAPPNHKILAITCLSEMLREDRASKTGLAHHLGKSGVVKALLDTLPTLTNTDFNNESLDQENQTSLKMLNVVLCMFTRLTQCVDGFKILSDCNALAALSRLPVWKEPPRNVFFMTTRGMQPTDPSTAGISQLYLQCVSTLFGVCQAVASTIYKKAAADDVLDCVSVHTELLNHLKRQSENDQEQHPLIRAALSLVDTVERTR